MSLKAIDLIRPMRLVGQVQVRILLHGCKTGPPHPTTGPNGLQEGPVVESQLKLGTSNLIEALRPGPSSLVSLMFLFFFFSVMSCQL